MVINSLLFTEFQKVVVETLLDILDELKSQSRGGDGDDEELAVYPLQTVEEVRHHSKELQKRPNLKHSLVSQIIVV